MAYNDKMLKDLRKKLLMTPIRELQTCEPEEFIKLIDVITDVIEDYINYKTELDVNRYALKLVCEQLDKKTPCLKALGYSAEDHFYHKAYKQYMREQAQVKVDDN